MIKLVKSSEGKTLTPNQLSLLIVSHGKLVESETDYALIVEPREDIQLKWTVPKELVPGVSEEDIKLLLGDTIYRQYLVMYNSAGRLEYDESSEATKESQTQ